MNVVDSISGREESPRRGRTIIALDAGKQGIRDPKRTRKLGNG